MSSSSAPFIFPESFLVPSPDGANISSWWLFRLLADDEESELDSSLIDELPAVPGKDWDFTDRNVCGSEEFLFSFKLD